jgi:hydroxyethylthiazole kinase
MGTQAGQAAPQGGGDIWNTWEAVAAIRRQAPVVHNITNYVVMNTTANALLALGASPVMAQAGERAAERGIPVVLDPVGAGATPFRTATARSLVRALRPAIIRGNASEIMAVCGDQARTKGVDSTEASGGALAAARELHAGFGSVVCISGATDYVVGGPELYRIHNGHPMMTRVTGLGCTATALCGAFAAVNPDPALAAAQAMAVMGVAGELAAEGADGPGSLQVRFLDALYRLTASDLAQRLRTGA